MGCQKAVILIVVFLFIAPFVFSQTCPSNTCDNTGSPCTNEGEIRVNNDKCICANEEGSTEPCWFPITERGRVYEVGTGDDAFDVVSDGLDWYGCDAEENDNAYSFPKGNEKGENIAISVTASSTHEYICYKKNNQEKWGECYGDTAEFSTTGGTTHPTGQRVPDEPLFYYCTSREKWVTKILDSDACGSAGRLYGGITWTGSQCCGEEVNDYYNDISAGCWYNRIVQPNTRVSDTNPIANSGFEMDSNGDSMPDLWSSINADASGTLTTADYQSRPQSYIITTTASQTGRYGIKSSPVNVRPGAVYNYSAYIKVTSGVAKAGISCYDSWHKDDEPLFSSFISKSTGQTNDYWKYLSGIFTTSQTAKHCHLLLYVDSAGSAISARFDSTNLHEDNPYVLYFGGKFNGCQKSDSDFSLPPSLITKQNYCGSLGDYFCSYSKNGWSNAVDDLNTMDDGSVPSASQRQYARTKTFGNLLLNPLFR